MRTKYFPTRILFAGLLSIAVGGCGTSSTDKDTGGTTGGEASGGTAPGGSGGSTTTGTGQPVTGGTTSTGGSTAQPVTGGTTATGGATSEPVTGGTTATGSTTANDTGGQAAGGRSNTGGRGGRGGRSGSDGGGSGGASNASGGSEPSGGTTSTGGGAETGGDTGTGGSSAGGATGTGGGTVSDGPCTASKATGTKVSGTGPHGVVMETNSDPGIECGTIYRPEDLGGAEKYPIFVWAEGACTRNGTSNQAAMAEIASHGYFVVADGPPNGGGNCGSIGMSSGTAAMSKPLLDYIGWAIEENSKSCSAYFGSIETTKVAADGFSCGGLMAESTAGDPRMTTWGVTSSGLTAPDQNLYKSIHTPVKILLGGSGDVAYPNGERDYDEISALGHPIVLFSKALGHGGDLGGKTGNGGDFTKVNLAWLNWQLKGDETATGKGFLIGDTCTFCKDSAWEVKSANIP